MIRMMINGDVDGVVDDDDDDDDHSDDDDDGADRVLDVCVCARLDHFSCL